MKLPAKKTKMKRSLRVCMILFPTTLVAASCNDADQAQNANGRIQIAPTRGGPRVILRIT